MHAGTEMPDGFEVPVYHAPLKPKLSLGAHRDFTFAMLGLGALAFLWKLWPILPLVVLLQGGAAWATRYDPKWWEKALRVIKYKRYYKA